MASVVSSLIPHTWKRTHDSTGQIVPHPHTPFSASLPVGVCVCVGLSAALDADSDTIRVIDVHNFAHLHTQPKRSVTQQQRRSVKGGAGGR